MGKIYLFATSQRKDVVSIKSLDVNFLQPEIDFSLYDYLIITSKQTIKALSFYNKKDFIDIPALCVSQKTAKAYEEFGGKVLDIGDGYGDNLVKFIKKYDKTLKWLYPRAKVIASDFVKRVQNDGFDVDEVILYFSECSKDILNVRVEADSALIFTSPSAIECFLKNNHLLNSHKVVVIGTTTAKYLPKDIEYFVSESTSIDSCIELASKLVQS